MKPAYRSFTAKALLIFIGVFLVLSAWEVSGALAQGEDSPSGEKTLSPYFFVERGDSGADQLPLKSTSAEVNVSGIIADVKVTQVYKNEGKKTLEAIYIFPASTRAAVYGMKMTIGDRTITAKIEKREEARQAYEKAKQEGKSASLLEQQRPNVFQMNVANILPGDLITTELRYTELLTPSDKVYEFIYPTVVGPRYSNSPESGARASEKWTQNPYLHQGEAPPYTFDIKVNVSAGMDIQEMTSPSHKVNIAYTGKNLASVTLDSSDSFGGNRDFILKYRLAGAGISSGMLLHQGKDENYFLLMVEPPVRAPASAVPPREYIFIVDISGSMHGYPLEISKKLFRDLASALKPTDTFNLLLFAGSSRVFSESSLPATPENVTRALAMVDQQQGGGGTELLPALQRALALPRTEGRSRTIVIATDGYVDVEPQVFELIRSRIGDANFFPFGIGTAVNRHLIEGMARAGAGEPFVIAKPNEAAAMAEKFRRYIQTPLLTRAKIDFGTFDAYDIEPAGIPDLFAERSVVVYGKWRGSAGGTVTLTGTGGECKYEKKLDVSRFSPLEENSALRYLWARSRIGMLSDFNNLSPSDARKTEITNLGLKYSLLTAFTSFVAIDSQVRAKPGEAETVKQPLPLPEGVSDYAVGMGGPARMLMAPPPPPAGVARESVAPSFKSAHRPAPGNQPGAAREPLEKSKVDSQSSETFKIENLSVRGGIPEEAVRRFLEQNLSELLSCMPKASNRNASPKWTLEFSITPDGTIKDLKMRGSGGEGVLRCFRQKVLGWVFPNLSQSGKTLITVKLALKK